MKTLTIYEREILERTGFRDRRYRFKNVTQYSIYYDGSLYTNHDEYPIDNPRLRIKFNKVLETRSKKAVNEFISKLGRTNTDKSIKEILEDIISEVK